MRGAFCSRALVFAVAVVLSSSLVSRYADANGGPPQVQVNTITLSYFPLIKQNGVPQDQWPLNTKQARQRLGLNPAQAAIDDVYGEYDLTLAQVKERVQQIESEAIDALEEGTRFHGYKAPLAKKLSLTT